MQWSLIHNIHLKEPSYQHGVNIIKTEDIFMVEYHLLVCKILNKLSQIRKR